MVKWYIGSGLFTPPEDETPEDWERNAKALGAYQEVEPIFPPEEKPPPAVLNANGEPTWEVAERSGDDAARQRHQPRRLPLSPEELQLLGIADVNEPSDDQIDEVFARIGAARKDSKAV